MGLCSHVVESLGLMPVPQTWHRAVAKAVPTGRSGAAGGCP